MNRRGPALSRCSDIKNPRGQRPPGGQFLLSSGGQFFMSPDTAALRERLIANLADLTSEDEAAEWVHKNLSAKNTLVDADADLLEASFRDKLAVIEQESAQPEGLTEEPASEGAVARTETPLSLPLKTAAQLKTTPQRRSICLKSSPSGVGAWPRKPFVCATSSTAVCRHPALRGLRPHIRFAQPRSVVKSATSIRSPFAVSITANCTATATKPHGGPASVLIRCRWHLSYGGGAAGTQLWGRWRRRLVLKRLIPKIHGV